MIDLHLELKSGETGRTDVFRFLSDENLAALCDSLQKTLDRWPVYFAGDILLEFYRFAGQLNRTFINPRNPRYLTKLFCSQYLMRKSLIRSLHFAPEQRKIKMRLTHTELRFHFEAKPVLGILITISLKEEYERFRERHIATAIQNFFPEVEVIKSSFYSCQSNHDPVQTFYLEIEKRNGGKFSVSEVRALKRALPEELTKRVETLDPSTFNIHREEEVLKNIAVLKRELTSSPHLPQVMLFFIAQSPNSLSFTVILLRTLKDDTCALSQSFAGLGAQFIPGLTKQFQEAEANLFRLSIPLLPSFVRTDFSINLYRAREEALSLINRALGDVRDYNGGLFAVQKDLFSEFRSLFKKQLEKNYDLLENFFHGITPAYMQTLLPVSTIGSMFRLFLKASKVNFSRRDVHVCLTSMTPFFLLVMVRTEDPSLREEIEEALGQEKEWKEESASIALNDQNSFFLGYFYSSPDKNKKLSFRRAIKNVVRRWLKKVKSFQSLRLCVQDLPISLDPRIGLDDMSHTLLKLLFEGLTRMGENGKPQLALAEKVMLSPDGKTYHFTLRESFWNNGDKVTAYDFAYAWKKMLSPGFSSTFCSLFYSIKNAQAAKKGNIGIEDVGIRVIDSKSLQVDLEHPCPYFLELTAHTLFSPVNARIDSITPNWSSQTGESYVCNGPFRLRKSHAEGFDLIKNLGYWGHKKIRLDQVLIMQATSPAAYQMFNNGEIDWLGRPWMPWQSSFLKASSQAPKQFVDRRAHWVVFNVQCFPFHNCKLRQALAIVLQQQEFVDALSFKGRLAPSPLPPSQRKYSCLNYMQEDQKKAQTLFTEALQELGLTVETFPPLTLLYSDDKLRESTALAIKAIWKKNFNIRCEIEFHAWSKVWYKMTEGDFQIGLMCWLSLIDDPIYTLNAFRYCHEKVNFSNWENRSFQSLLSQADQTQDSAERRLFLTSAEAILLKEMPVVSLFDTADIYLSRKTLTGFSMTRTGDLDFCNAYFSKKQGDKL